MMYYELWPLKHFRDAFNQQTALIVGSGPTKFPYQSLHTLDHPTFLLNDTIHFEKHTADPSFFYSSASNPTAVPQPDNKNWFEFIKKSHCLVKQAKIRPEGVFQKFDMNKVLNHTPFDLVYNATRFQTYNKRLSVAITGFPEWVKDKNYICENNCLFSHQGSITALIHFLWFCGFNKVKLIGCGPVLIPHHSQEILKLNGGREPAWDLPMILENQQVFLTHFGLEAEYLGVPDFGSSHPNNQDQSR